MENEEQNQEQQDQNQNDGGNEAQEKLAFLNKPADEWTVDDVEASKKYTLTLKAQKEHFKTKAEKANEKKETEINKTNETVGANEDEILEKASLLASGTPKEIIREASALAKAKGIKFSDAMKDPLIEAYSEKLSAEDKRKKAQLGASNGSGGQGGVELKDAVGMSREEHKKALGF